MPETVGDGFYWTPEPWGNALRSRHLGAAADHFFTSLPLRLRGRNGQEEQDWARVAATIGVPTDRLLRLKQVHGNRAIVVRADAPRASDTPRGGSRPEADILLSSDPGVALAVQVADCVPLLIADRESGAVAAAHAGWRGTVLNVAGTAVATLVREFGSKPSDLVVGHGPSIGPCCYTVGDELIAEFERGGFAASIDRWFSKSGDGRLRLDLWTANRDQLLVAGVPADRIHLAQLCTASQPRLFHSYRRDGKGTGRMAAVIRARGTAGR